ncbi:hypothetical protein KUTeg_004508 [Tegillarca granosa]|uniref:RNA polymerase I-specific transcription initiation factor RRN3 n=1 Tax=Tegillarca granosa TaxID=220873 RepID=A0ABQ9FQ52_TEGGR|nr:hypothetical protein KUTeg_004508 [Tegillarca granosa]
MNGNMSAVKKKEKDFDLSQILENYKRGSRKEYDIFVSKLVNPFTEAAELRIYLSGARDCVVLLDKDFEDLVGSLLKVDWPSRESSLIQEYQSFLLNLVSAHTYYLRAGLRMLVKHFLPKTLPSEMETDLENQSLRQKHEQTFINIHMVLKAISKIVPMTPALLMPLLNDLFPYMTKDAYIQACYVKNLLQITHYIPTLRQKIMELIVDRMLKLDVRSPRTDIEESEADEEDMDEDIVFDMEDIDISQEGLTSPDIGYHSYFEEIRTKPMSHKDAEKLDVMMDLFLKYTHNNCYVNDGMRLCITKQYFQNAFIIDDKSFCLLQAICEGFLDFLWKKVKDPNTQTIFRQIAVSYMSSLISRGMFVPLSTVTACLDLMCEWLHKYLDQTSSDTVHIDITHHGSFYAVCQSVFYVFVFRNKEIFEMKKGYKWSESLNFQRIVTSRLNPLKFCLPVIAKTFASVTRMHQLAFCDTIMERNNRCILPVVRKIYIAFVSEFQGNIEEEDKADTEDDEDDFLNDEMTESADIVPGVRSLGKTPTDFLNYGNLQDLNNSMT